MIIKSGTERLKTDNNGNDFGAMYGIANEAINNNAKTLLTKKMILFKKDKFFKSLF